MLVHEGQPPLWMMILLIAWRWLNVASMLAAMVIRADLLARAPEGKVHVQCADRPVCRQPVCELWGLGHDCHIGPNTLCAADFEVNSIFHSINTKEQTQHTFGAQACKTVWDLGTLCLESQVLHFNSMQVGT